jgi:hypothetical protein
MHETLTNNLIAIAKLQGPSVATNTLFVHGGIDMDWLDSEGLLTSSIEQFNALVNQMVLSDDGLTILNDMHGSFLWTRDLANEDEDIMCDHLIDPLLQFFNVSRIIVGHTPQYAKRVRTRCDEKIILADVMVSKWMTKWSGAQPVALIFQIDSTTADLESIDVHYSDVVTSIYKRRESIPATGLEVLMQAIQQTAQADHNEGPPNKKARVLDSSSSTNVPIPSILGRPPLATRNKRKQPRIKGVKFFLDISKEASRPTTDPVNGWSLVPIATENPDWDQ